MAQNICAGIDLHKTQFTVCVLVNGKPEDNGTKYPMSAEGYGLFTARMRKLAETRCSEKSEKPEKVEKAEKAEKAEDPGKTEKIRLAVESTGNTRFFREVMERSGFEVVVVNTLKFKVVNLSTNKTDKNDAKTLAEFLEKNMLPQSHLCSAYNEGIRRVLKSRALMVQNSVALKNQAHAVLLAYGKITKPSQFQSRKSRICLLEQLSRQKNCAELKQVTETIFETLDLVERQIKRLETRLREMAAHNRQTELLMTIPGIGIVNACTLSAYIDDISRFETYKHFSAYCGIVPWVQTSNESVYYGRITKRGPQELRTALVQCVVAMVRMPEKTAETRLMRQYARLKETKSSGKAIIATARKLSRIIYVMLRDMEPYNPNRLKD